MLKKETRKKGVMKRSEVDHVHIMCRTEVSHKEGWGRLKKGEEVKESGSDGGSGGGGE